MVNCDNNIMKLKDVCKIYKGAMVDNPALKEITVEFLKGEFVAIVGKSGSGKSTFLNMISGIDRPTSGEICYYGENICSFTEAQLTKWRGDNIGIIFQFFQLIPTLTVIENVMLPMDFSSKYQVEERKERAKALLRKAGIEQLALKFPSDLSGGEQQRAAVARSLANDPSIIFADEPTGNLDTETTENIMSLFKSVIDEGRTIFMVTHNMDLALRADRVVTLRDGLIIKDVRREENMD